MSRFLAFVDSHSIFQWLLCTLQFMVLVGMFHLQNLFSLTSGGNELCAVQCRMCCVLFRSCIFYHLPTMGKTKCKFIDELKGSIHVFETVALSTKPNAWYVKQ